MKLLRPGIKLGELTVLEQVDHPSRKNYWRARCGLCQREIVRRGDKLLRRKIADCGCATAIKPGTWPPATTRMAPLSEVLEEAIKGSRHYGYRSIIEGYKRGALDRGLAWQLSDEEFCAMLVRDCVYCGKAPSNRRRVNRRSSRKPEYSYVLYSGVDRVDNSLGYLPGNCAPCCSDCNMMKRGMPAEKFVEQCMAVADRFEGLLKEHRNKKC